MKRKFQVYFLWFLIVFITVDAVYTYLTDEILELFYIGSVYVAAGIGLEALNKLETRSTPLRKKDESIDS